jgi:S-adenosylmethionine uptake transporter
LLGIAGTAGHILIARSYQLAPAAVVAPMFYTLLLWGIVFGYVFWQEIPSFYALSGAAVIIVCGLFIVRQEQKEKSTHHHEEP